MRKATSDIAGHADKGRDGKISQPGEPAEQEADAVADHVADKLHGGSDKAGADPTTKEAAPQIGAKRDAGTISLAKKDDKKPDDKKPQKDMTLLGAKGNQCTSKTMWKGKGKERIDVENPKVPLARSKLRSSLLTAIPRMRRTLPVGRSRDRNAPALRIERP